MPVISLGPNCLVSILARQCSVRTCSYPFDWKRNTTVNEVIDVIKNQANFNVQIWFEAHQSDLPHDAPLDSHGLEENQIENASHIEKYCRRFDRFFRDCNSPSSLFIRFQDNDGLVDLQKLCPQARICFIRDTENENWVKDQIIFAHGPRDRRNIVLTHLYFVHSTLTFPTTTHELKHACREINIYGIGELDEAILDELLGPERVWHDKFEFWKSRDFW